MYEGYSEDPVDVIPISAKDEIPVIDISPFFLESLDEQLAVANKIKKACENIGFFYVKNHNVPQNSIEEVYKEMDKFFSLPIEKKEELKLNEIFRGYFGFQQEITNNIGDWKEGYDLGFELPLEHPDVKAKKPLHGPNQWPSSQLLPGWREKIEEYSNKLHQLGQTLMKAIAMSLGKNPNYFLECYGKEPILFMRLLKYFPSQDKKLGVGTHTDYGCITILSQDSVGGLQVKNRKGEWISADPIPGTFVVNIGDMLQIWTNDHFKATLHRVITNSLHTRMSIAFCYEPNFDSLVEPLDTCLAKDEKSKYAPIKYGDYVMQRIFKSFPTTK